MVAVWIGTMYDCRQMRIRGNYCWNVRARKATSGMEGTVKCPTANGAAKWSPPRKTKGTTTRPEGYTTRGGHVASGPGRIERGRGGHTSGTSSGTRKLGMRNPNCTYTGCNDNTHLWVRLEGMQHHQMTKPWRTRMRMEENAQKTT